MSETSVTEALGDFLPQPGHHVSVCLAKWYFRYLVGLSDPATGALALARHFTGRLRETSGRSYAQAATWEGRRVSRGL
jgi:hypothetical protein